MTPISRLLKIVSRLCSTFLLIFLFVISPSGITSAQTSSQWDGSLLLDTVSNLVKTDKPEDVDIDFSFLCFPGEVPSAGIFTFERYRGLILSPDGDLSGQCQMSKEDTNGKVTVSGSLTGKLDFPTGRFIFSGTSDFLWTSSPGAAPGRHERHLTYQATGTFPAGKTPSSGPYAKGLLTFTYQYQCDVCEHPHDPSYTGTLPFDLTFEGTISTTPVLRLDRQQAARFSAIRVSGSGFKPKSSLRIVIGGDEAYDVDVLPNGGLPKDTWIFVPDATPFGVNPVWAEPIGGGEKSNVVALTVAPVSQQQLVEHFDEVVSQYLATIPRNERWYGKLHSGAIRNIVNAGQTVGATILWLPTAVLTLGHYQDELWPDNQYVCSWYQAEVLTFFNNLRFNPDPAKRALLDGLDDGPFNSGIVPFPAGSHFFAVLWPHAAALDPSLGQQDFQPSWETAGVSFDPWPKQAPEVYELQPGSASWAEDSAYASHWKSGSQYHYTRPRPEPANFDYNQGDYPITGGKYYNPKGKGSLADDYHQLVGIGEEPPKMVAVHSPVTLAFQDEQGNRAGMDARGELFDDIPGSEMLVIPKPQGGYEWYVALPNRKIKVTVTGVGDGSYQLITKNAGQAIMEYPAVTVTKGATSIVTLDDQGAAQPLQTGEAGDPTSVHKWVPQPKEIAGTSHSKPFGLDAQIQKYIFPGIIGIALCGMAALGFVGMGIAVWFWLKRSRRRSI